MGSDLSIAVAVGAGLLSFLSPCVLPLVPAYVGQLTAVAVVGRGIEGDRRIRARDDGNPGRPDRRKGVGRGLRTGLSTCFDNADPSGILRPGLEKLVHHPRWIRELT